MEEKKVSEGGGKSNKVFLLLSAIMLILVIGVGYKYRNSGFLSGETTLSQDEAKEKVTDYIKNNLVPAGTEVEVKDITLEGGIYKVIVVVSGKEITSYMSKDGSKFFPDVMNMDEKADSGDSSEEDKAPASVPVSEKPSVELFVMSYCPYGTQIEKGILPVLSTLGDKIDFSLKFVDYAMHDKKELDENLRQYCIEKNQPEKLASYLECFLKKGQGTEGDCMNSTGIAAAAVTSCTTESDKEFEVTENYNDKSTWSGGQFPPFEVNKSDNEKYGVQGSPTLVINGTVAKSGRDSASLLKTICGAFENVPEECQVELSSTSPSPGFGEGTGASTDANCGS